jgi:hypothetical protein
LNIGKSSNWAEPTGRGPKWASTGATGAQSHSSPPQRRSPSGDCTHGREGTGVGHRRLSPTHVPWWPYPFAHGRRGESSASISPPCAHHHTRCSALLCSPPPAPLLAVAGYRQAHPSPPEPAKNSTASPNASGTWLQLEPPATSLGRAPSPTASSSVSRPPPPVILWSS